MNRNECLGWRCILKVKDFNVDGMEFCIDNSVVCLFMRALHHGNQFCWFWSFGICQGLLPMMSFSSCELCINLSHYVSSLLRDRFSCYKLCVKAVYCAVDLCWHCGGFWPFIEELCFESCLPTAACNLVYSGFFLLLMWNFGHAFYFQLMNHQVLVWEKSQRDNN